MKNPVVRYLLSKIHSGTLALLGLIALPLISACSLETSVQDLNPVQKDNPSTNPNNPNSPGNGGSPVSSELEPAYKMSPGSVRAVSSEVGAKMTIGVENKVLNGSEVSVKATLHKRRYQ